MKFTFFTLIWVILTTAFTIYGSLIRRIGSGTGFYLVWYGFACICFIFALCSFFGLWKMLPFFLKVTLSAAASVIILLLLVTGILILSRFHEKAEPGLDYIIVLGAQIRPDGSPSAVLAYRLNTAVDYLNENPGNRCVVSGGQGGNEPCTEAAGMKQYLLEKGISGDRIITEGHSVNTSENFANSRTLIPEGASAGVITNNFHMYRALLIADTEGFSGISGVSAPSRSFYLPNNMLREFFGLIKFYIR